MTTFSLPHPLVAEPQQQTNNETLVSSLNSVAQFFFWGVGVPSLTPPGRALYIRLDGGTSTTLYVYEGAAWVAK